MNMEQERLIRKYLESKGIDIDDIDLTDYGQFLEDNHFQLYDKVNKQFIE